MLLNANVALCTNKIVLVPYSSLHVPRYHEWMKDPDIQKATASEPLTIEEEYDMQRSWRLDADKLTFIAGVPTTSLHDTQSLRGQEGYDMIGDVNLFISIDQHDTEDTEVLVGELELMIAEKTQQGRGLGRAVLVAFLQFVVEHEVGIVDEYCGGRQVNCGSKFDYLRVKIGKDNERSLRLFAGLGFTQVGEANYFGEVEMRRTLNHHDVTELRQRFNLDESREISYEDNDENDKQRD